MGRLTAAIWSSYVAAVCLATPLYWQGITTLVFSPISLIAARFPNGLASNSTLPPISIAILISLLIPRVILRSLPSITSITAMANSAPLMRRGLICRSMSARTVPPLNGYQMGRSIIIIRITSSTLQLRSMTAARPIMRPSTPTAKTPGIELITSLIPMAGPKATRSSMIMVRIGKIHTIMIRHLTGR